ncbi:MAG: heme o synthase [Planctomycetota bacterium]
MTSSANPASSPGGFGKAAAFLELGKLRLSALAVLAALAGLYMGAHVPPDLALVLYTLFGTLLVAAGGNALNMFLEREADSRMERTAGRPLPTGRLAPRAALAFGLVTVIGGLALLRYGTTAAATAVCAAIAFTYVLVYTPLKRHSTLNTLFGAIPGALPPVVGYAAATNSVDQRALALFLILFLWQVPHFLSIAWYYRADYERAGMKMLPVVSAAPTTARQMVLYCSALVLVSLWPRFLDMTGDLYLFGAILLGILFLVPTVVAAWLRTDRAMRQCFRVSIIYLPLLLGIMVLDNTVRP